jgi:hypothetical protein
MHGTLNRAEINTEAVIAAPVAPNADSSVLRGRDILVSGRVVKVAQIRSEAYSDAPSVQDWEAFVTAVKRAHRHTDIVTFAQSIHELEPKFSNLPMEWDNFAVIALASYDDWWKGLSQDSRRNVRLAEKRGVKVELAAFDDKLIHGIKAIYDEAPVRQGAPNRHYNEDFETVKRKNSTYLDRNDFLVAYFGEEIIGFAQLIYADKTARIMQVLTKTAHAEKRPTNLLIAKAVELACQKNLTHLIYCKYTYGKKSDSPLTEFKRRMGFKELKYPRYFVPVTLRGKIALKLGLHADLIDLLPGSVLDLYLKTRTKYYQFKLDRMARSSNDSNDR